MVSSAVQCSSTHVYTTAKGTVTNYNVLKSYKLQYGMLGRWVDGTIVSLTNRLMFRVLLFFHNFLQNSLQKSFQVIFYNFTKDENKEF